MIGALAVALWGLLVAPGYGQVPPTADSSVLALEWRSPRPARQHVLDSLLPKTLLSADASPYEPLQQGMVQLAAGGFWGASLDSLVAREDRWIAWIYLGPSFAVATDDADSTLKHPSAVRDRMRAYVRRQNEQGYPHAWAQVRADSSQNADQALSLVFESGARVDFDSIEVHGASRIHSGFLHRRLGWRSGMAFSQEAVEEAERILRSIPFLEVLAPPRMVFYPEGAVMRLYLKDRPTSYIHGLLGLLPETDDRPALLNGEVTIFLQNAMGYGAEARLRWERPQPESQELEIDLRYPFVGGWPLNLEGAFKLDKFDTLYLHLEGRLTAGWQPDPYNEILGQWKTQRSFGLQQATDQGPAREVQDYRLQMFGAGYRYSRLERQGYSPYAGRRGRAMIWNGQKAIQTEETGSEPGPDAARPQVFQLEAAADFFQPLGAHSTLLIGVEGGYWIDTTLAFNQQYRLGGLESLRGVPQRSLFTSRYALTTQEYRLLFEDGAYIQIFHDLGFHNQWQRLDSYQRRHGMGAGYNFAAPFGIFSLQYAYALLPGQAIDWRSGWLHFGFRGQF